MGLWLCGFYDMVALLGHWPLTWKSCGLSDSSFLDVGVLFFLLLPG